MGGKKGAPALIHVHSRVVRPCAAQRWIIRCATFERRRPWRLLNSHFVRICTGNSKSDFANIEVHPLERSYSYSGKKSISWCSSATRRRASGWTAPEAAASTGPPRRSRTWQSRGRSKFRTVCPTYETQDVSKCKYLSGPKRPPDWQMVQVCNISSLKRKIVAIKTDC